MKDNKISFLLDTPNKKVKFDSEEAVISDFKTVYDREERSTVD